MGKKSKQFQMWIGLVLVLGAMALAVVVAVIAMSGNTTGNMEINGNTTVKGLKCTNGTLVHPAFVSRPTTSYLNTITAVFRDDELSSISLLSEGNYGTSQMAEEGRAFASADYNITLTDKYGEKADVFSANFTTNGSMLQLAQATRDISKINGNTVTYFLLDQGTNVARSLEGLKNQYEAKGFTCEISD